MLTQTWQNKWTETHDIMKESDLSIRGLKHSSSMGVMIESQMPHLVDMDDDILSTGVTIYHLKVRAMWRSLSPQGESNVKVTLTSRWQQSFRVNSISKAVEGKFYTNFLQCRGKSNSYFHFFSIWKMKIIRGHYHLKENFILKNMHSRLWTLT